MKSVWRILRNFRLKTEKTSNQLALESFEANAREFHLMITDAKAVEAFYATRAETISAEGVKEMKLKFHEHIVTSEALIAAIKSQNIELCKTLIALIVEQGEFETDRIYGGKIEHVIVTPELLLNSPMDTNDHKYYLTPLVEAAVSFPEIIPELLTAGASALCGEDSRGIWPLEMLLINANAIATGEAVKPIKPVIDAIEALVAAGARNNGRAVLPATLDLKALLLDQGVKECDLAELKDSYSLKPTQLMDLIRSRLTSEETYHNAFKALKALIIEGKMNTSDYAGTAYEHLLKLTVENIEHEAHSGGRSGTSADGVSHLTHAAAAASTGTHSETLGDGSAAEDA